MLGPEGTVDLRRLFVASIVLVVAGLLLLLPSSALYNLLTQAFAAVSSPDNTTATESLAGFAMIVVGALLEIFAVLTDFPVAAVSPAVQEKQA